MGEVAITESNSTLSGDEEADDLSGGEETSYFTSEDEETAYSSGDEAVSGPLSPECPEVYTPHLEIYLSGFTHPYDVERALWKAAFTTEPRFRTLDPRAAQKPSRSIPEKRHTNWGCRYHQAKWKFLVYFQHLCSPR